MIRGETIEELEKKVRGFLHESKEFGVKVIPEDFIGEIMSDFFEALEKQRKELFKEIHNNLTKQEG